MSDQLYPEQSAFEYGADLSLIAQLLLPPVKGRTQASVICLPSFDRAWSLRLQNSRFEGASLHSSSVHDIETDAHPVSGEVGISMELADAITNAWTLMLKTVSYSSESNDGLDGEWYHFSGCGDGVQRFGCVWSPTIGSASAHLTQIAGELRNFAESGAVDSNSQSELIDRISQFTFARRAISPPYDTLQQEVRKILALAERGIICTGIVIDAIIDAFEKHTQTSVVETAAILDSLPDEVRKRLKEMSR